MRRTNFCNIREGSSNPRFLRFFVVFEGEKVFEVFKRKQT